MKQGFSPGSPRISNISNDKRGFGAQADLALNMINIESLHSTDNTEKVKATRKVASMDEHNMPDLSKEDSSDNKVLESLRQNAI